MLLLGQVVRLVVVLERLLQVVVLHGRLVVVLGWLVVVLEWLLQVGGAVVKNALVTNCSGWASFHSPSLFL